MWAVWKALELNISFDEYYFNNMENSIEDQKELLAKDKFFMDEQILLSADFS